MSRKRREPLSSLDLLLDTICNTFGGVLFLAILVSVLLKTSSRFAHTTDSADTLTESEILEEESQHEEVLARLESLRRADREQQKLAEQLAPPETAQLLAELYEAKQRRDRADAERQAMLTVIAKERETTSKLVQTEHASAADLIAAERDLALAAQELKDEIQSRTRTARLPRVRPTSRSEVALSLRYGRLYVCHKYDRFGSRQGLNMDEFVVIDEGSNRMTATAKPYAGVPVGDPNAQAILESRLKAFDPQRNYLAIIVWEDSFEACQALKNRMIALGFEYRLILLPEGSSATDRGGTGGKVQ